jgi:hypothetical protein
MNRSDPGLDSATIADWNEDAFDALDFLGQPQQEKMKGVVTNTKNCRALSVSWRLSETWLSGSRASSLRCVNKLKHKPSTTGEPQ